MADWVPIDDPNDPRLANTPLNEPAASAPQAPTIDFQPAAPASPEIQFQPATDQAPAGPRGGDHRDLVTQSLLDHGVKPVAAAAILGDIQQESGFDPHNVSDHGSSFGLLQVGGPMFRQFQQDQAAQGIQPGDPQYVYNQAPFVINKFAQQHPDRFAAMQNAPDAPTALKIFRSTPDWGYGIAGKRYQYAQNYQQALSGVPVQQVDTYTRVEKAVPVNEVEHQVARALPVNGARPPLPVTDTLNAPPAPADQIAFTPATAVQKPQDGINFTPAQDVLAQGGETRVNQIASDLLQDPNAPVAQTAPTDTGELPPQPAVQDWTSGYGVVKPLGLFQDPNESQNFLTPSQRKVVDTAGGYVQSAVGEAAKAALYANPTTGIPLAIGSQFEQTRPIAEGIVEGTGKLAASQTTLENLALIQAFGMSGLAGVEVSSTVGKTISNVFAAQMASQLPEIWQAFKDAPDLKSKVAIATEGLGQLALTVGAAKHGVFGEETGPAIPGAVGPTREAAAPAIAPVEAGVSPAPAPGLITDTARVQPGVAATADVTRAIVDRRNELVNEAQRLGQQAEISRQMRQPVHPAVEARIAEINQELNAPTLGNVERSFPEGLPEIQETSTAPTTPTEPTTLPTEPTTPLTTEPATPAGQFGLQDIKVPGAEPAPVTQESADISGSGQTLRRAAQDDPNGFGNVDLLQNALDFGKRVYQKGMDFATWSAQMLRHLGGKIQEHLGNLWASIHMGHGYGGLGSVDPGTGRRYVLPDADRASFQPLATPSPDFEINRGRLERSSGGPVDEVVLPQVRKVGAGGQPRAGAQGNLHTADALSEIYSDKVRWFRGRNGQRVPVRGFEHNGQIFLNADMLAGRTGRPLHLILAHEIAHSLETNHPDLYNKLLEHAKSAPHGDYFRTIFRKGYEGEEGNHELVADLVADTLADPANMSRALGQRPGLFQGLASVTRGAIDTTLRRAGVIKDPTASGMVRDLKGARDDVMDALKEARARRGTGEFAAAPQGEPRLARDEPSRPIEQGLMQRAVMERAARDNVQLRKAGGESRGVRNEDPTLISTRRPSAVNATEDPNQMGANRLHIGVERMSQPQLREFQSKVAAKLRPWMPKEIRSRNDGQMIENAINFFKENKILLHRLAEQQPWLERAMRQYEGYNIHGHNLVDQYGFTPEGVFGAETVMSSGKSPDASFSMAERLMRIMRDGSNVRWDARFDKTVKSGGAEGKGIPIKGRDLREIRGKTFNELTTHMQKARWARVYDQTFHSPEYPVITPEGTRGPLESTKTGTATLTWTSFPEIAKALRLLDGTSHPNEVIETAKHSNYYNSKRAPGSHTPDYVADRHDVSGSYLMPLGSHPTIPFKAHPLLTDHFSGLYNARTGDYGIYALHAEAGRRAAAELGLTPSDFQAGHWSYQRGFMSPRVLGDKASRQIQDVWKDTYRGKRTIESARAETLRIAGDARAEKIRKTGYDPTPTWAREPERSAGAGAPVPGVAGQPQELPGARGPARAAGPGGRGGTAEGAPEARFALDEPGKDETTTKETISAGNLPQRSFRVTSPERRRAFYEGLRRTNAEHPQGASVEVKDPSFYQDPGTDLFLSDDGLTGVAVTKDGNLVSVFRHPEAQTRIGPILTEAAQHATHLEAFTAGDGKLPNLYSQQGFRPVARIPFDRSVAPSNWDYARNGEPDIIFMVRDPGDKLGLPDVKANGYAAVKDQIPVERNWDKAQSLQRRAVEKLNDSVAGGARFALDEPPTQTELEDASAANDPEKMRGHIATIKRMTEVSPDVKAQVESWYTPTTLDAVNNAANETINKLGLGKATDAFMGSTKTDAGVMALGHNLALRLDEQQHYEDAAMVRDKMAEKLTTPAQSLWYISTIGKTSPEGLIRTAQDLVTQMIKPEDKPLLDQINRLRTEISKLKDKGARDAATKIVIQQAARVNKPGQRLTAAQVDELLQKHAAGNLDENQLAQNLARYFKIPRLTPENITKIKAAQKAWADVPDSNPILKQVRAADMMDTVYGLVPRSFWDKVRAASVISMIMHGKLPLRIGASSALRLAGQTVVDGIQNFLPDMGNIFSGKATRTGGQVRGIIEGMADPLRAYQAGYTDAKIRGLATVPSFKEGMHALLTRAQLVNRGFTDAAAVQGGMFTFSSRFGRLFENTVGLLHNVMPLAFYDAAYRSSLYRQMRAARVGVPDADMVFNAHLDANKVISNNPTMLYKFASEIRKGLDLPTAMVTKGKYGLGTALLPFALKPASLLSEGLTWTPLGLGKATAELLRPVFNKGEPIRPKEVGDALVKAALGTGVLVGAGYQLAKIGVLTGAPDDNKDLEAMRKASGWGAYKINVSELKRRAMSWDWHTRSQTPADGDYIVNYNWLEPAAFPVAAGADLAQSETKRMVDLKRGKILPAAALSAAGAGVQSLVDSPMLQGVQQFAGAVGEGQWGRAVVGLFANVPGNFVPALVRQTSQYMDNTVRETKGTFSGPISGGITVDREASNILTQIPGLEQRYPAKYDVFGNAIERYNYGNNSLFNVFFNPAMISKFQTNPQLAEMQRLYEATGASKGELRQVPATLTVNGKQVELTNEQVATYQRYVGKEASAVVTRLLASPQFAAEPMGTKQAVIANVLGAVNNAAKMDLFGQSPVTVGMGMKGPTVSQPAAMDIAALIAGRKQGLKQSVMTPGPVAPQLPPLWRLAPPPALPSRAP